MTSPISEDTTTSDGSKAAADSTKSGGFLADTVDELKLVVWPSRQQLFSESIAVILMVSLSAATIAAVSRFFGWASSQVVPLTRNHLSRRARRPDHTGRP